MSRSAVYRAAAAGHLPTLRFGRRVYVPTARLLAMLGIDAEEEPRGGVRKRGETWTWYLWCPMRFRASRDSAARAASAPRAGARTP